MLILIPVPDRFQQSLPKKISRGRGVYFRFRLMLRQKDTVPGIHRFFV
nr:hypothetical protein [uncultured Methanoregula sp.]